MEPLDTNSSFHLKLGLPRVYPVVPSLSTLGKMLEATADKSLAIVIVSVPAVVVILIPVPATSVSVSVVESALTVDCPATSISLKANVVDDIMFAATELGIVTKTVLLPPSKLTNAPAFDDESTVSLDSVDPAEVYVPRPISQVPLGCSMP